MEVLIRTLSDDMEGDNCVKSDAASFPDFINSHSSCEQVEKMKVS